MGWETIHRTTYFRKVNLWRSIAGVPSGTRGVRLLGKFTGGVLKKLVDEILDVACSRPPNGGVATNREALPLMPRWWDTKQNGRILGRLLLLDKNDRVCNDDSS